MHFTFMFCLPDMYIRLKHYCLNIFCNIFCLFLVLYGVFWRFDKETITLIVFDSKLGLQSSHYHNEKQNFKHKPQINFSTIMEELSIS